MDYRVLGPVEASSREGPVQLGGPKQRLVLALLLVEAGRVASDDRLIDGVWHDDPPARPRHILQTYVSELRRLLDDEIRREGNGYRLVVDADAVDAHRFTLLAATGREQLTHAPAGAAGLLREALALWHGTPYADLGHAAALQPEIHRLEQARLVAVEDRIRADLDCGRHADVAAELEALTREHPYREPLRALHMQALYQGSRQADALRVYERTRDLLTEQLGIDPSPELQALHARVLGQDPALAHEGDPTAAPSAIPPVAATSFDVVRGFELRERLGEGDFGTSHRAYQAAIGREVVVKVMRHGQASTAAAVHAFESRARQVAHLRHPHLVPVLDYWREPEVACVVTPWYPAGDARRTLQTGPWSLAAIQRMLEQVGDALATVHQHGAVHGDVRASNVLLDPDGNAYLSDFPVVRRRVDAAGAPHAAAPVLVAPEERLGRPVTPRSDVYGLAVLTIELLAGTTPDEQAPADTLARTRDDLPSAVIEVLRRASATAPDERHDRVEDLLRDLRRAAGTDVVGPPGEVPVRPLRNPYKGLRSFQEADAQDFFGRERVTDQLVDAIRDHRLVAVVGPSGSGKSSVVRAGLLPVLRSGALPGSRDWLVTELYPGSYPFEELEAALLRVAVERPEGMLAELVADDRGLLRVVKRILPQDDSELVLVIDQFEELFSLTADPALRRLFLDSLVTLAGDARGRVRTVLTLRGDFFDRPLEHHEFGELLLAGLVPVTMPSFEELSRAVAQPIRQVGATFEDGLVPWIVRDVAEQPGGLPLLQHALTEMFGRRDGHVLTAQAYEQTGGVLGALGGRAEESYRSLSAEGQEAAEQLFLRLVGVDEHTEDARRRVRRSELGVVSPDADTVDEVLRTFGAHRLVTFDRDPVSRTPTVEVAHEALFRQWSRLAGWIDARREDLLLHKRLVAAVVEWDQADRSDDHLLAAGRLEQFRGWDEQAPLALTERERGYLQASRTRQDLRTARRRRRRLQVVAVAVAVAVLGLALAGFASVQQARAARSERVALARALAAESRTQLDVDHDLAVLLALEAVQTTRAADEPPATEAVQALHDAVRGHRLARTADHGGSLVHFLGDGERMLTAGPPQHRPVVWDAGTTDEVLALDVPPREPAWVATSPDGRLLAQTYIGQPVTVWDLETGQEVARLDAPGVGQWQAAFGPDGRRLAVLDDSDGSWFVSVWDVASESQVAAAPTTSEPSGLAFSPDGRAVAVSDSASSAVWIHDADTADRVATAGPADPSRGVASIAFDPAGRLAIYLGQPSEIQVFALDASRPELSLAVGADPNSVCISADGTVLAATAADEVVRVWDTATGSLLLTLPGTSLGGVLDCGPNGRTIATGTPDGTARIWDITTEGGAEVLTVATPRPWDAAWDSAGVGLWSTHEDGSLRHHDASTGRLVGQVSGVAPLPPSPVVVSPDGRFVAVAAAPTQSSEPPPSSGPPTSDAIVHDSGTLASVRRLDLAGTPLGFTRHGQSLLTAGPEQPRLYDVASGTLLWESLAAEARRAPPGIAAGTMLGDDHAAVAPFGVPEAWLLDRTTGDLDGVACTGEQVRRLAASPDGQRLAIADEAAVTVWDAQAILDHGPDVVCPSDATHAPITRFVANAWLGLGFSPDSSRIVTAGFDGSVQVWEASTGRPGVHFRHDAQAGGATFSPDGHRLLAAVSPNTGPRHSLQLYTLRTDELIEIARATVTRQLTPDECDTHTGRATCPP